ncbi:MAG: protein kinase [Candidatus Melainabacteria bacterium]|nr:protein kinase [Candidatus Melainabacteria bacterium]
MSKELVAGQKIQNYEIVSILGRGGMSRVYLCEDLVLHRRVALKQLLADESDARGIIRIQQEGQSLARLSHPNIVKILTYFNTEDGAPFLVMEVLHGCSLAEFLSKNGSLSVGEVLKLAQQMCDALQHAHDYGIVHRDIKPSNIFLCDKKVETAKIIDFGIAKIADNSVNATRTGEFVGSPAYLSPEQALQKNITVQSDQYSLGCVLYECLTGHPPFEDSTAMGLILKHVNDEVVPLGKNSFVPPAVAKAIERSLKKNPEDRFSSMAEFKNALEGKVSSGEKSKIPLLVAAVGTFLIVGISLWVCVGFLPTQTMPSATSDAKVSESFSAMPDYAARATSSHNSIAHLGLPKRDVHKDEEFIVLSLKRNPKMEDFALGQFSLSVHALKTLSKAENLKGLHLSDSNITDDAGQELSKISTLESLDVARTSVGDVFLEKISTLPKLNNLSLGETNVTSRGLESLVKTPSLRALSIRSCEHIDDSAAAVLKRMPWLRTLDAAKTDVSDSFVRDLGPSPGLTNLALSGTKITQKCLPLLSEMKSLNAIYLDDVEDISDLSTLKNLKLQIISLRNCNINANTARQIAKFKDLWHVRLDRTVANDDDLLVLAQLPKLKQLDVVGCALISKKGLATFKKLKPNCNVTTEKVKNFRKYLNADSDFGALDADVLMPSER